MLELPFRGETKHYDLFLPQPTFDSHLTGLIINLDYSRKMRLYGTTTKQIFFQLKHIFHILESIGSARIEGNNTTIAEYLDTKIGGEANVSSNIREIMNIEKAMAYIESNVHKTSINRAFISDIHKMIVEGLDASEEGDRNPGEYRKVNLKINKSSHVPPDWMTVNSYMDELFDFINKDDESRFDLLKTATAHHRFVWIHPFGNGNGRTVRLLTYAMLLKSGYKFDVGRILNPTAVFCINRDDYYANLAIADQGTMEGVLTWCEYMLEGLKVELEKIDKLLDYEFLKKNILLPTIKFALEKKEITEIEAEILKRAIESEGQSIQALDIKDLFAGKDAAIVSRQIQKLIAKKMLSQVVKNGRRYYVRFDNNYLIKGVMKALGENHFLAIQDTNPL